MKYTLINISLITLFKNLLCCQFNANQEPLSPTFDNLEYTSDNWGSNDAGFSMKIDKLGKVTVSKGTWEARKYFQGQLKIEDLNNLFRFVKRNDFSLLKPEYVSKSLQDGTEVVILMNAKGKPLRRFRLYGREVPLQLDSLRNILFNMSYSLKLDSTKHKTHFNSRVGFYPKFSRKLKGWFPEE